MSPFRGDCIFQGGSNHMEVIIRHLGNVKFEATTRGHRVISDQPAGNGGNDTGMTPPELLLSSLGTCAGFYAAEYMKVRGLHHGDLRVTVTAEKAKAPARLAQFHIDVEIPGLDPQYQEGVLRAVKACLIHNTLLHGPAIETTISTPVEALAG